MGRHVKNLIAKNMTMEVEKIVLDCTKYNKFMPKSDALFRLEVVVVTNHRRVVGVESLVEVVHLDGDADKEVRDANVSETVGELVDRAGNGVDKSDSHSFHSHHTQASNQRALICCFVEMFKFFSEVFILDYSSISNNPGTPKNVHLKW